SSGTPYGPPTTPAVKVLKDPQFDLSSTVGPKKRLRDLGLVAEYQPGQVRIRTTTAESIIQFTACLARGDRLILRDGTRTGRVVVTLRDFDGDSADLPALASYTAAETWLRGLPSLRLDLTDEEREAIARWLYPPEAWLTDALLGRLP